MQRAVERPKTDIARIRGIPSTAIARALEIHRPVLEEVRGRAIAKGRPLPRSDRRLQRLQRRLELRETRVGFDRWLGGKTCRRLAHGAAAIADRTAWATCGV